MSLLSRTTGRIFARPPINHTVQCCLTTSVCGQSHACCRGGTSDLYDQLVMAPRSPQWQGLEMIVAGKRKEVNMLQSEEMHGLRSFPAFRAYLAALGSTCYHAELLSDCLSQQASTLTLDASPVYFSSGVFANLNLRAVSPTSKVQ